MNITRRWPAILLVLALVLAACGGDDASDDGGEDSTTTTTAAPTTTTTTEADDGDMDDTTTTTAETMDQPLTDVGVDLEEGVITIGLLSDLSADFAPLIQAIVAGQEVFWEDVNRNGGIHGLQVELEVRDTAYDVEQHIQLYEELKDEVVAFGHSTGSVHTLAINEALQDDGILAIPLTWYSGWSDPAINSNLIPHGIPYCLEAMNNIEYIVDDLASQGIEASTLAIATVPGDLGLDQAAGAEIAAEALGLEIVYDGRGEVFDAATIGEAAGQIASSGADIVFAGVVPPIFDPLYSLATSGGFEAKWTGAFPMWSPAFVAPDSAIKDAVARDVYLGFYGRGWGADTPGNAEMRELMAELRPEARPFDYYVEGFIEGRIMRAALEIAYENGDLTQAGVLAAAKSIEALDFEGMAPPETYDGEPNDIVQRVNNIYRPDPEGLVSGTNTGMRLVAENYTADITAAYEFTGACYQLGG